jgi:SAM-dependent methyltransferase
MTSDHEVRRLEATYADYKRRGLATTRWGEGNAGNRAIMAERRRVMRSLLADADLLPLDKAKVLEVGCGTGHVLASLVELGAEPANLFGVDLLTGRVEQARRAHPEVEFAQANAEDLPVENESIDLLLLFVVFSSILDPAMRQNVAAECARVLRPGGSILWYDFRYDNPQNPHVRGVGRRELERLFPGFEPRLRMLTLIPQVARRLGPLTPLLYPLLAAVPPLRTYYMGRLVKPARAAPA